MKIQSKRLERNRGKATNHAAILGASGDRQRIGLLDNRTSATTLRSLQSMVGGSAPVIQSRTLQRTADSYAAKIAPMMLDMVNMTQARRARAGDTPVIQRYAIVDDNYDDHLPGQEAISRPIVEEKRQALADGEELNFDYAVVHERLAEDSEGEDYWEEYDEDDPQHDIGDFEELSVLTDGHHTLVAMYEDDHDLSGEQHDEDYGGGHYRWADVEVSDEDFRG